jgi:hypothetical protein
MWCSNRGAVYTGLLGCDVVSLGMYFLMFGGAVVPSLLLATARLQTYRYNFPLKYLVSVYRTMRCNNPEVYSIDTCVLSWLYYILSESDKQFRSWERHRENSYTRKVGARPALFLIFVLFDVLFVLCHFLYCLYVYVYCTAATGWLPNCS